MTEGECESVITACGLFPSSHPPSTLPPASFPKTICLRVLCPEGHISTTACHSIVYPRLAQKLLTNGITYVHDPIQKAHSRTVTHTTRIEAPPSFVTLFRTLTNMYRRPSWYNLGSESGCPDLRSIARADGANTIAWPV